MIVGGGATGVELAAVALGHSGAGIRLDNIDADSFLRLTILNMDPRLLQLPERNFRCGTKNLAGSEWQ